MTREEAIKSIQDFTGWFKKDKPIYEALEMAIKALEQEPCEDANANQHNSNALKDVGQHINALDAISRRALLDAFGFSEKTRKWGGDHSGYNTMMLYEIQDMIESAPPVKPQYTDDEIQAMQDLEQAEIQKAYALGQEDRPTGQWIYTGHWIYDRTRDWDGECKYECSECGMGSDVDYPFCMRCGARMESEDKK